MTPEYNPDIKYGNCHVCTAECGTGYTDLRIEKGGNLETHEDLVTAANGKVSDAVEPECPFDLGEVLEIINSS